MLHGHRVSYHAAGPPDAGSAIVLIHGITADSGTWRTVVPALARTHRVIAPDLLGHGLSAKPRGDYSLGAYAAGIRDLLGALGVERATVIGHSLGGGVAMQLAYQFPERLERLVLVSSGGLGREVSLLLRAATLPGAGLVLPVLVAEGPRTVAGALRRAAGWLGLRPSTDVAEVARGMATLAESDARAAFLATLSAIVDHGGQRVSATDRLYLASAVPTLIVWGAQDAIIPVEHGAAAHAAIPGSRLEVFDGAGHFPHLDDPMRFLDLLEDFLAGTEPADIDEERWRERLRAGA